MRTRLTVCALRSRELRREEGAWLEVSRPNGTQLRVCTLESGRYALWDPHDDKIEEFPTLVALKERIREK